MTVPIAPSTSLSFRRRRTPGALLLAGPAALGALLAGSPEVAAQSAPVPQEAPLTPPAPAEEADKDEDSDTDSQDTGSPRASGGGQDSGTPRAGETVVTALRHPASAQDVPQQVRVIGEEQLRTGPDARSLPNALTREPGVLVQKTGPGQSSPFIRGFTGFRTLLMVDGIRLNNSTFRDGPNQYFSTVDQFAVDSLELTYGPASALWGSDAIGGSLNALTGKAEAADGWHGRYFVRWSSAERALFNRIEAEGGEEGSYALRVGISEKNFGDIKAGSGSGDLPGTSYDERDLDFRLDVPLDDEIELTFVGQHVQQNNVPRTHTTVDAVIFDGTTPGTDLERDLDQTRDLYYGRLSWEGEDRLYDNGRLTLSWQRQQEEQKRIRTGGRKELLGFDVQTVGAQLEFEKDSPWGLLTWGVENYHDNVNSWRRDYVNGVKVLDAIQGPIADDSSYNLFGAYIQDEVVSGAYETVFGLRWSHAQLDANSVDNPDVGGNNPATPGNVISIHDSWDALVGSVRSLRHVGDHSAVFAGLSQGFRAPNLSDVTADLVNSGIEEPTPGLDPEYYLQAEIGGRTEGEDWRGELAVYHTWMRDMIVESPTGEVITGVPVLQKDNIGDGTLYGFEARGERDLNAEWIAFTVASWQSGNVDQFTPAGVKVGKPTSRVLPLTTVLGATYRPIDVDWWLTADTFIAAKADQLSLKDETDTQRIPPGGTPGYGILGVRTGWPINENTTMTVGLENIFNHDYRIHGSGVNEPGRSLVLTLDVRF